MRLRFFRVLSLALSVLIFSVIAFAASPVITVTSPANNSQTTSPVNYIASASSPGCAKGISAMRIYSAPGISAYTGGVSQMNTYINLPKGTYNTVVQAWDNCGGVGKAFVTVTTTAESQPAGFVYTVNSDYFEGNTTNNVQGFTIVGSNGALAPTGQAPVNANQFPISVASDKGGYRLYVGDYISGDVFAYFIDRRNGYLTKVPGSPFPVNRSVTAVAVHPSGKLVFATRDEQAAGDGVAVFQLQNDGSLKPAAGSPYPTQNGPQALVVDPTGKYLYIADESDYIDAFEIDTISDALTPLPGSPFKLTVPSSCDGGAAFPSDIIDPFGSSLYTADSFSNSISGFGIAGTTGTLAQIAGSPWNDGGCNPQNSSAFNPSSLAVDRTGKFMYALNEENEDIAIYSIASDGSLSLVKFTPNTSACGGPIRSDSTGNYLYAFSCGTGVPSGFRGLVGFSINHTTGDLTPLPTSPYTYPVAGPNVAPQSLTVTP